MPLLTALTRSLFFCIAAGICGCEPAETKSSDSNSPSAPPTIRTQAKLPQIHVRISGKAFNLEISATELQHEIGLMGRSSMKPNEGMIFLFEEENYRQFWMKNCLIPLDIIYLNSNGLVVGLRTLRAPGPNAAGDQIPSFPWSKPEVRYVIELNGGTANKIGLEPGQKVSLPLTALDKFLQSAD